ncbi:hypothetical protein [Micromonospora echinofusca]|uniref:DUF4347 domain-containing protein n=1 Tax=Micromonospora echinofusca TaxID=47858 RepID=A0ABS3VUR7_MICEH|nr:hypothetical protein [Micromonospora echinofusca]MBO4208211.1 hypothetical protein [Micromonospora echinofusca]
MADDSAGQPSLVVRPEVLSPLEGALIVFVDQRLLVENPFVDAQLLVAAFERVMGSLQQHHAVVVLAGFAAANEIALPQISGRYPDTIFVAPGRPLVVSDDRLAVDRRRDSLWVEYHGGRRGTRDFRELTQTVIAEIRGVRNPESSLPEQGVFAAGRLLWLADRPEADIAPLVPGMVTVVSQPGPRVAAGHTASAPRIAVGGEFMTAVEFADYLRGIDGWPEEGGPDVLLMAGDSGVVPGVSFAAQLRDALRVGVLASRTPVFTRADGDVRAGIGLSMDDGQIRLQIGVAGWEWYAPIPRLPVDRMSASLADTLRALGRQQVSWPALGMGQNDISTWGGHEQWLGASFAATPAAVAPAAVAPGLPNARTMEAVDEAAFAADLAEVQERIAALEAGNDGLSAALADLSEDDLVTLWRYLADRADTYELSPVALEHTPEDRLVLAHILDPAWDAWVQLPGHPDEDGLSYAYVKVSPGLLPLESILRYANNVHAGPILTGARRVRPEGSVEIAISNQYVKTIAGLHDDVSGLASLAHENWCLTVTSGSDPTYVFTPFSEELDLRASVEAMRITPHAGLQESALKMGRVWDPDLNKHFYPIFLHNYLQLRYGNESHVSGVAAELRMRRDLWRDKTLVLVVESSHSSGNPFAQRLADLLDQVVVAATGAIMVLDNKIESGGLATFRDAASGKLKMGLLRNRQGWHAFWPRTGRGLLMGPFPARPDIAPVELPGVGMENVQAPLAHESDPLNQVMPTYDVGAALPRQQPPVGPLSDSAQAMYDQSIAVPGMRILKGNPVAGELLEEVVWAVRAPTVSQMYTIDMHGGEMVVKVGDAGFDPFYLAEVLVNDPYWQPGDDGKRPDLLLGFCNPYAQSDSTDQIPFLPVAQRCADALVQKLDGDIAIYAAGGLVSYDQVDREFYVNVMVPASGGESVRLVTDHPAAKFYKVAGRRIGEHLSAPVPSHPRFPVSAHARHYEEELSEPPVRVPLDLEFPVSAQWRAQPADLMAAELVGLGGDFGGDLQSLRVSAPDQLGLSSWEARALWRLLWEYEDVQRNTAILDTATSLERYEAGLWRGLVRTAVSAVNALPDRGFGETGWGYVSIPARDGVDPVRQVEDWLRDPGPGPVRVLSSLRPQPDQILIGIGGGMVKDVTVLAPDMPGSQAIGLANLRGVRLDVRPASTEQSFVTVVPHSSPAPSVHSLAESDDTASSIYALFGHVEPAASEGREPDSLPDPVAGRPVAAGAQLSAAESAAVFDYLMDWSSTLALTEETTGEGGRDRAMWESIVEPFRELSRRLPWHAEQEAHSYLYLDAVPDELPHDSILRWLNNRGLGPFPVGDRQLPPPPRTIEVAVTNRFVRTTGDLGFRFADLVRSPWVLTRSQAAEAEPAYRLVGAPREELPNRFGAGLMLDWSGGEGSDPPAQWAEWMAPPPDAYPVLFRSGSYNAESENIAAGLLAAGLRPHHPLWQGKTPVLVTDLAHDDAASLARQVAELVRHPVRTAAISSAAVNDGIPATTRSPADGPGLAEIEPATFRSIPGAAEPDSGEAIVRPDPGPTDQVEPTEQVVPREPAVPTVQVESVGRDEPGAGSRAGVHQVLWLGSAEPEVDPAEQAAVQAAPRAVGMVTILSHFDVAGQRIQVGEKYLNAVEFAAYLRRDHGWPERGGRDVVLVACETGRAPRSFLGGGESFARRLRAELQVGVLAPRSAAFTLADGQVITGGVSLHAVGGRLRPLLDRPWSASVWKWYDPDPTKPSRLLDSSLTQALEKGLGKVVVVPSSEVPLTPVRWSGRPHGPGAVDSLQSPAPAGSTGTGAPLGVGPHHLPGATATSAPTHDAANSGAVWVINHEPAFASSVQPDSATTHPQALPDTTVLYVVERDGEHSGDDVDLNQIVDDTDAASRPVVVVAVRDAAHRFTDQLRRLADTHPETWFLAPNGAVSVSDGLIHAGPSGTAETWESFHHGVEPRAALVGAITPTALAAWRAAISSAVVEPATAATIELTAPGPVPVGNTPAFAAPDRGRSTGSTSTPSEGEQLDVAWAVDMLPVLEMRLRHAEELASPDAVEIQAVAEALTELRVLVQQAEAANELPTSSLARLMATATVEQMRTWQEIGQRRAVEASQPADNTGTQPRQWLSSVLYREFPIWTGVLNRAPDALVDADFLPVVQQVLDPAATVVTAAHLTTLDNHIRTLVDGGQQVTVDALIRRAAFDRLKAELGALPTAAGRAAELDQQVVEVMNRIGGLPDDRRLEMRGLIRDLLVEREEHVAPTEANLRILDTLISAAYRRYAKSNDGASPDGPLGLSHLQDLLQHKLGDRAQLTWQNMTRLADRADARELWRKRHPVQAQLAQVARAFTVKVPAVRTSGVYRTVLSRHERTLQKQPGQVDSPAERLRETNELWNTISAAPAAPQSRTPIAVDRADLAALVRVRRTVYADARDRRYTGLSDYQAMATELLGADGRVGAAELAQLAALVREARANGVPGWRANLVPSAERYGRSVLRRQLTESALSRWHDGRPGPRPIPPGVAGDHSRLVSSFHAIGEMPFVPALTAWLNSALPFGTGAVSEDVVSRTLMSSFAQVLDDGAVLTVNAGGRTYDIRLWAVPTGAPTVEDGSLLEAKQEGSTRFPGKQELRIYRYEDRATGQASGRGRNWDAGITYRNSFGDPDTVGAGRVDASATYGRASTQGRRQLAASALSDYQQLRIKEPLGWVRLPVNWVARVQENQGERPGRWRDIEFRTEDGTPRQDDVRYAVAQFQLPYSAEQSQRAELAPNVDPGYLQEKEITTPEQFPVWDMDHAVSRLQLADRVLTEVRRILDPDDYAFWKPAVEAYLTNDQMVMGLRDILRPRDQRDYQQVFRQTLQRDGRYLSFSLTAGDLPQPVNAVTKISEVSRSGETRFDKVSAVVLKTLLSVDDSRSGRGTLTGGLRVLAQYLRLNGRAQYTRRTAEQHIRHHRAILTRASRVGGTLQVLLANFTVQLDVHHQRGTAPPVTGSAAVPGYAHFLLHSADLRALPLDWAPARSEQHRQQDTAEDVKLAQDATPDPDRRWWSPGAGFGVTMDFVERLDGVQDLYDAIADRMVQEGHLPADASPRDRTPWEHLQTLAVTGADLNRPGQGYANWQTLLSQLSEQSLRTRADDVLGADADQPGVTMTFPHPSAPADLSQRLTIGLRAEVVGDGTHQGITKYQVQYGHASVDTMAAKGAGTTSTDISGAAGLGATVNEAGLLQGQHGRQHNTSSSTKLGRTQSTSVASDTDGQKMPSSRYVVPIRWTWFAELGDQRVGDGSRDSRATLLQPDSLHARASDRPLPPLSVVPVQPTQPPVTIDTGGTPPPWLATDQRFRSPLTTMGTAIYTTIGVRGVGALQQELIAALPDLPKAAVWQGLTSTVYKSALLRALSAAATIPIGDRQIALTAQPVGRPEVVRVWFPYTQQVLESQVGHEQGTEALTLRGRSGQANLGGTSLGSDGSGMAAGNIAISDSTGAGEGQASLYTVGSYRGIYQDTEMAVVRTVVVNRITMPAGPVVETFGEVLLNVLLADVLAHRDAFDHAGLLDSHPAGPTQASTPPLARALTTRLDPPVSLQDGLSWAVVWPMVLDGGATEVGFGALTRKLTEQAASFGEPDLVTQVRSLPSWLSPYLAKMRDGGATWTFKAGGRTFELVMTAELVGPARDSRPGATGEKIYDRGNAYQDTSRRNVTSTNVTIGASGANGLGQADGHWGLNLTESRSKRVDQADTRGSNLLFMTGLRANKLTDFTQAVRFDASMREITDLGTRIVDGLRKLPGGAFGAKAPVRDWSITVTEDHVVSVPTEGTLAHGAPRQDFGITLRNRLPATFRIEGMLGLQAIFDAVASTGRGRTLDPATVTPTSAQLTFESIRDNLAAMLTHEGARFDSVATATEVRHVGAQAILVRARFDRIRQLYYMEKAELENYDHATDLAAHSTGRNNRHNTGVTADLAVELPAGIGRIGPRVGVGVERTGNINADRTAWIERRPWLRSDTSVFFVYATLNYEISVPGTGEPLRRVGGVELVVDQKGAREMGIPIEDLMSVVPPAKRAKEFPDEAIQSGAPQPHSSGSSQSSGSRDQAIVQGFRTVVGRLGEMTERGASLIEPEGPRPAPAPADLTADTTGPVRPGSATASGETSARDAVVAFRSAFGAMSRSAEDIELTGPLPDASQDDSGQPHREPRR